MEVSSAYAAAAIAASHAVEVILADEIWQPETGRARALAGAKDAAEAFQKVSRALRLTLAVELRTAAVARELRAGIRRLPFEEDAGETPAVLQSAVDLDRRRPAGSCSADDKPDCDRPDHEQERLVEFECADRLPRGSFREIIDALCADLGVTTDWAGYDAEHPVIKYKKLQPRPPGWSECRPPGSIPAYDLLEPADPEEVHPTSRIAEKPS